MVYMVLVLVPPTSTPRKLVLAHTGMMGGFVHLIIITWQPLQCHLWVGIIHFVMLIIICLVLFMVIVNLVLVLRPKNLSSYKSGCWIDCGNFLSSRISSYSSIIHINNYRSSYSLSKIRDDPFRASGDGRVDVETITKNVSSHKIYFVTYRHVRRFIHLRIIS